MRFKKLIPKSERSKICYVSYAIVSSNFQVDCYECYTTNKICQLNIGLKSGPFNDMCNVLYTLRDVSLLLQFIDVIWNEKYFLFYMLINVEGSYVS